MDFKISNGLYPDIETWLHDSEIHNKLFRVFHKNPKWDGVDPQWQYINVKCDFMFFTEFIILPDNDVLIGMQAMDENRDNMRYPSIDYYKLSEVHFEYVEQDNIELWENENTYDDFQTPSDEECELYTNEIKLKYIEESKQ